MRLIKAVLATSLVVLLVAGCSKVVDGRAVVAVPPPGSPIQWGPCESTNPLVPIPADGECGKLSVPVDYSKPDGDVAQLAMIRFKATGNKIGSLIVNPGGPGESGVEAAASLVGTLPQSVRQRFDVVGFDPRGVANSTPAVWCNSDADNDRLRADPQVDYTPAGVAHIEKETKEFVQRCVDKMGKEFLENVGTVSVVKDLDAMRAALGDAKLTYLGYSYGTRIGSAYAEAFPRNVRAMILDGAVDPEQDAVESLVAQGQGFGTAFTQFAKWCTAQQDCALGQDANAAVKVFQSLIRPLLDFPVPVGDGRKLSYEDATTGVIQALYQESLWDTLNTGLNELKQQRGATLEKLADVYNERDSDGKYGTTQDAFTAIRCVDDPRVTDPAVILKAQEEYVKVAPFLDDGRPASAARDACAFWPVPNTSEPHVPNVEGLAKTLVISTTNDPATPYQAGVNLAKGLKGALLTYEGTQHTVFLQGVKCVDEAGTDYLVDGTLPPDGKRCSGQ